MKRYIVFAGDTYYPCGGIEDYVGAFDSLEEAKDKASHDVPYHGVPDWAQVAEVTDGGLVRRWDWTDDRGWVEVPHDG